MDSFSFPEVDLISIDGEVLVSQGDLDQPLLVILFDNRCPHCITAVSDMKEMLLPAINQMQLDVIGIGREHDNKYLKEWVNEEKIKFKVVADPDKQIYKLFYLFLAGPNGLSG